MKYKKLEKNGRTLRVYEDGRIYKEAFTVVYSNGRSQNYKGSFIKQQVGKRGYYKFNLPNKSSYKHYNSHRIIAEAFLNDFSQSLQVDHIDGNKLNNNVNNLRMVTQAENLRAFQKKRKNSASQYLGVFFDKDPQVRIKKWYSRITFKGKRHYLGNFKTEEEAALAYNKKAKELGFAPERLNKV